MKNNLATFISGISMGILIGLSESEILAKILVPILTVVIGALSILVGYKTSEKGDDSSAGFEKLINRINLFPIMFLVVGIVVGAFGGLYAKNYDIMSPKTTIVDNENTQASSDSQRKSRTILRNLSKEFCESRLLCGLTDWDLLCQVYDADDIGIKKLLDTRHFNLDSITAKIHDSCQCDN